jgi:pimeloyl-ACP methyl ester carboxylesterase
LPTAKGVNRAEEPLPAPWDWWTDDPVERMRRILEMIVAPASRAKLSDETLMMLAEGERDSRTTWAGTMRQQAALSGHDLRNRLGEIRAPTLVVHGDLDLVVRSEHGEVLAAGIPDARYLRLAGVGHAPWLERTAEVTVAVLEFLEPPGALRTAG